MVYYTKTLEPCHPLTQIGEEEHRKLLEFKADEILFRSKHPFRYWFQRMMNWIETGDSEWDGAQYSEQEKYKDGYSYSK